MALIKAQMQAQMMQMQQLLLRLDAHSLPPSSEALEGAALHPAATAAHTTAPAPSPLAFAPSAAAAFPFPSSTPNLSLASRPSASFSPTSSVASHSDASFVSASASVSTRASTLSPPPSPQSSIATDHSLPSNTQLRRKRKKKAKEDRRADHSAILACVRSALSDADHASFVGVSSSKRAAGLDRNNCENPHPPRRWALGAAWTDPYNQVGELAHTLHHRR